MTALASPEILHAAVEGSFPPDESAERRSLWRIDRMDTALYLLVFSGGKPDFTHIIEQFGWPENGQKWESKSYDPLIEHIETGQRWHFRLRANPVHSVKRQSGNRGKIYAHVTVRQQEQWLSDRAESHGFNLQKDSFRVVQREVRQFRRKDNKITLSMATFEGILTVTDNSLFLNALTCGIGRAKAYGCGLLTIAALPS